MKKLYKILVLIALTMNLNGQVVNYDIDFDFITIGAKINFVKVEDGKYFTLRPYIGDYYNIEWSAESSEPEDFLLNKDVVLKEDLDQGNLIAIKKSLNRSVFTLDEADLEGSKYKLCSLQHIEENYFLNSYGVRDGANDIIEMFPAKINNKYFIYFSSDRDFIAFAVNEELTVYCRIFYENRDSQDAVIHRGFKFKKLKLFGPNKNDIKVPSYDKSRGLSFRPKANYYDLISNSFIVKPDQASELIEYSISPPSWGDCNDYYEYTNERSTTYISDIELDYFYNRCRIEVDSVNNAILSLDSIKQLNESDLLAEVSSKLFAHKIIVDTIITEEYIKPMLRNVFGNLIVKRDLDGKRLESNFTLFSMSVLDETTNGTLLYSGWHTMIPFESGFKFFKTGRSQAPKVFTEVKNELIEEEIRDQHYIDCSVYDVLYDGNFFGVMDSLLDNWLIPPVYDSIRVSDNFFTCFKNESESIYNPYCQEVDLKKYNVRDYAVTGSYIQVLIDNEVKYINKNEEVVDTMQTYPNSTCGFGLEFFSKIIEADGVHFINTYEEGLFDGIDTQLVSSLEIGPYDGEIIFAQNVSEVRGDESSEFLIGKGLKKAIYRSTHNPDKKTWSYKLVWEKEVDEVIFDSTNYMFLFKEDDLYGHVDLSEDAKYLKLDPFIYNFSRFTFPNGKKGWINRRGKEFFDK